MTWADFIQEILMVIACCCGVREKVTILKTDQIVQAEALEEMEQRLPPFGPYRRVYLTR